MDLSSFFSMSFCLVYFVVLFEEGNAPLFTLLLMHHQTKGIICIKTNTKKT